MHEGCGHNCQQICKFVSLVMRIMDFILMSLFIRMPGGLGPFGGNKLQTLPMHFKTHQCHIKGKKNVSSLSVHCSVLLGEPSAVSHGTFYCCKLLPYLAIVSPRYTDTFGWGHVFFFHPSSKNGVHHDSLGSGYQCGHTIIP